MATIKSSERFPGKLFETNGITIHDIISLQKQRTFRYTTTGFPAKGHDLSNNFETTAEIPR